MRVLPENQQIFLLQKSACRLRKICVLSGILDEKNEDFTFNEGLKDAVVINKR